MSAFPRDERREVPLGPTTRAAVHRHEDGTMSVDVFVIREQGSANVMAHNVPPGDLRAFADLLNLAAESLEQEGPGQP